MRDESLDKIFTLENIDAIYTNALLESYYGANGCFFEENQLGWVASSCLSIQILR